MKLFCYCCKRHITVNDEKEFRRAGHVDRKDDAMNVYKIKTNYLPKSLRYPTGKGA